MKFLLLPFLLCCALGAKVKHFSEERYIYGIDRFVILEGAIDFLKTGLEITYETPQKRRIVYNGETMAVYDAGGTRTEEVKMSENPQMRMYFQLMQLLEHGDTHTLERYFRLERDAQVLTLYPLPPADKVIERVDVLSDDDGIRAIKTMMSNHDEITITIAR